jgi:hypothetical protein
MIAHCLVVLRIGISKNAKEYFYVTAIAKTWY